MIECRADVLKQIGFKLDKKENIEGNAESNSDYYFYRGHSSREYQITPYTFRDDVDEYENYHNALQKHSNEFVGLKPLEVLSKMQHYETPTRLMDVSRNPLVAAYFAIGGFGKTLKDDKLYPEVLEFRLKEDDIKKYDSDVVKLLSHLPLLKPHEREELRIDAINELLINAFVESSVSPCWKFIFKDFAKVKWTLKIFLNILIKDINKNAEKHKGYFQKSQNNTSVEIDHDSDIIYFDLIDPTKEENKKKYSFLNENNKRGWLYFSINLEKLCEYYPSMKMLLEKKFSFVISSHYNPKKQYGSDNFSKYTWLRVYLPNTGEYFTVVFFMINDRYFIEHLIDDGIVLCNDKYTKKCPFANDEDGMYMSNSMDLLQYQISQNYPTFRTCAKVIDLLNGVYVNPCITTDRMNAQKGAFMLFGLSRYWDIGRCADFLYGALSESYQEKKRKECDSNSTDLNNLEKENIFREIVKFLIDDNPIRNNDGSICEFFKRYNIKVRDFENYVFNVRRFKASNRLEERKKILERLDFQDINEETLGCSLENSYNYLKYKMQKNGH